MGSPQRSPQEIAVAVERLRGACAAISCDPAEIALTAHMQLVIGRTSAAALANATSLAEGLGMSFADEQAHWLVGTPDEICRRLEEYAALGISACILGVGAPFDLDGLKHFAAEVIPAFP